MKAAVALSALAVALTLSPGLLHAQGKTAVEISCTKDDLDLTGTRFCSALRADLARSSRYKAANSGPRWVVRITTMAYGEHQESIMQSINLTYERPNLPPIKEGWVSLWTDSGTTSNQLVDYRAKGTFSDVDNVITEAKIEMTSHIGSSN